MQLRSAKQLGHVHLLVPILAFILVASIGTYVLRRSQAQTVGCNDFYYQQGSGNAPVVSNNSTKQSGSATVCTNYIQKILNGEYQANTAFAQFADTKYGGGFLTDNGTFDARMTARVKAFQAYFANLTITGKVSGSDWTALCGAGLHMPRPDGGHYWEEVAAGAAKHSGCSRETLPAHSQQNTTSHSIAGAPAVPQNGQIYIGVNTDPSNLSGFNHAAGIKTHPAIVGAYTTEPKVFSALFSQYSAQIKDGSALMISWKVPMTEGQVTNGSKDAYITQQAQAAKAYGRPIFVRLDWEMNGNWYPDFDAPGGTSPAAYISSWKHIYSIFQAQHATNAAFVWCPNIGKPVGKSVDEWYPGDQYVDWVCADGYPQYEASAAAYLGNTASADDKLNDMAQYAAAHNKPMMLGEWALGGHNGAKPYSNVIAIDTVFQWAAAHQNSVKALVYFNYDKGSTRHMLKDYPDGSAAFRNATINKSTYLYNVAN